MQSYRVLLICLFLTGFEISLSQTIGTFNSIQPGPQTEAFVIPSTHIFQRLIKSGDALPSGGVLGNNLDFTGYVPISGSSRNGYLSISSETTPAECSILSLSFNSGNATWGVTAGGKVNFPTSEIGSIARFCSGTVTPDNTIMICEEAVTDVDVNGDGYQDIGWVIEVDPVTRTVINQDGIAGADKLWAVGRQSHENVAIKPDESVIYWGADAHPTGYMYKFVPTTPGNYTAGALYTLQTTAGLGTGTWQLVSNTTQLERNNTVPLSTAAGAFNFNGIEDVEIGPDNKIYFAAKGPGVIYRFRDLGTSVDQLEEFVSSVNYDVDDTGPYTPEPWGLGNDNLAFDGEGNLWVLQDGSRNHIWVVSPSHTAAQPAVRLFATTPIGSEPTGITFTPDYNYMFISFQHPSPGNTTTQVDAAGNNVVFNTHTTMVVARKEMLGPLAALPVRFNSVEVKDRNTFVEISWNVDAISNHLFFEVERSIDGSHFTAIARLMEDINHLGRASFSITDNNLPASAYLHYRIRQCDKDGRCVYSVTRIAKNPQSGSLTIYPVPAKDKIQVSYYAPSAGPVSLVITNSEGRLLHKERKSLVKGNNRFTIPVTALKTGRYFLFVESATRSFIVDR